MPKAMNTLPAAAAASNDTEAAIAALRSGPPELARAVIEGAGRFKSGAWSLEEALASGARSAERPSYDWRDVEGAAGPASATWLALSEADTALWVAPGLLAAFEGLAHGKEDVKPATIEALWWHLSEHVQEMARAIEAARDLVRPLSLAERAEAAKQQDEAATETPARKRRVAGLLAKAARKMEVEAAAMERKARGPSRVNGKAHKPARGGRVAA